MAKRTKSPTDGGRFKRAAPSGTWRGHVAPKKIPNTKAGETLWTPALQARIVNLIRAGNYAEVAARACGVSKSAFHEWLLRGGKGEEPFAALAAAVHSAAAETEAMDVANIGKHSLKDWRASAWRLERKNFKRWGRRDSLEITGDDDKPLAIVHGRIDPKKLTAEQKAKLKELMEAMRTDGDEPSKE